MANENVRRSFHSIDSAGRLVEGGPLDERLRNLESRLEGGPARSYPLAANALAEVDAVRKEVRELAARMPPSRAATTVAVGEAIDSIGKRIAAIEKAMRQQCAAPRVEVPALGTARYRHAWPHPVRVAHVRLDDQAYDGVVISSIVAGMAHYPDGGAIDHVVPMGQALEVSLRNDLGIGVSVAILIFYERADVAPPSHLPGYTQVGVGAEMALRRKGRV